MTLSTDLVNYLSAIFKQKQPIDCMQCYKGGKEPLSKKRINPNQVRTSDGKTN